MKSTSEYAKLRVPIGPRPKPDTIILIAALSENVLYNPSTAAATMYHPQREKTNYRRMKSRLYAFASSHDLRESADGRVEGVPAWLGRTWKEIFGEYEVNRAKLLLDLLSVLEQSVPRGRNRKPAFLSEIMGPTKENENGKPQDTNQESRIGRNMASYRVFLLTLAGCIGTRIISEHPSDMNTLILLVILFQVIKQRGSGRSNGPSTNEPH